MVKRKGLGRGLDALLGVEESSSTSEAGQDNEHLKELPVEFMRRGKYQPRRDMHPEALEELADSIRAQGVMQPIVVRQIGAERYEIIAGERRWRAAQKARLHDIPALVRELTDRETLEIGIVENVQRSDLKEHMDELTTITERVHLQLRALLAACFIPPETDELRDLFTLHADMSSKLSKAQLAKAKWDSADAETKQKFEAIDVLISGLYLEK